MSRRLSRRSFLKLAASAALAPLLGQQLTFHERFLSFSTPESEQPPSPATAPNTRQDTNRPNIIFLVFDTLSARHMSLYGYRRRTTPNLERFANQATVFHHHYAAGNFTSPGTASLLTGVYPWQHRAFQQGSLVSQPFTRRSIFHLVGADYHRLGWGQNPWADLHLRQFAEALDTHLNPAAYSLFSSTFWNRPLAHKDPLLVFRGFENLLFDEDGMPAALFSSQLDRMHILLNEWKLERYRGEYPKGIPNLLKYNIYFRLEDVMDGVIQQLRNVHAPYFSYWHFFSPHEPYVPRREFIGIFEDHWIPPAKPEHFFTQDFPEDILVWARLGYDENIAHLDAEFGRLWDTLRNQGKLENSYVIVTSDHGQLFERGVHGHVTPLLYEGLCHIPLLIHQPGQNQRVDVNTPTNAVDLLPTLLQAIGQPIPEWCDGVPLLAKTEIKERPLYTVEAKTNSSFGPLKTASLALIRYPYKLIAYRGFRNFEDHDELYQLENDPEEIENLASSQQAILREMQAELHDRLEQVNQPYYRKG